MESKVKNILVNLHAITKAPLTFFDIESTGLDKIKDDIIQLYLCKYDGKDFYESSSYYNTNKEITEEAFGKHGLTQKDLEEYPYFEEKAKEIFATYFTKGTILCGFNSDHFDIPFIIEKMLQSKIPAAVGILNNKRIDVMKIYRQLFPNTLEGIYERMIGEPLGNAHDAAADISATIQILDKCIATHGKYDLYSLNDSLDTDGFFKIDGNTIIFSKGKHKGQNVMTLDPKESLGYLKWVVGNAGFSIHTISIARKLIQKIEEKIISSI